MFCRPSYIKYLFISLSLNIVLVIDYVEPFWSVMHRRRDKAAIPSHIGKHKQLYPTWSTLSNCKLYQLNCKNKHLYPNCSTSNCKLSLIEILKRNFFISLDQPFHNCSATKTALSMKWKSNVRPFCKHYSIFFFNFMPYKQTTLANFIKFFSTAVSLKIHLT